MMKWLLLTNSGVPKTSQSNTTCWVKCALRECKARLRTSEEVKVKTRIGLKMASQEVEVVKEHYRDATGAVINKRKVEDAAEVEKKTKTMKGPEEGVETVRIEKKILAIRVLEEVAKEGKEVLKRKLMRKHLVPSKNS